MPYSYDPSASGLISEGPHILTIVSIEDTISRNGDPMWIVRLEDNQRREVTEWIVQTPRIIEWKFRPLWQAAGLEWPTAAAILDEQQLVDRTVTATIVHETSDQYGTSAKIGGYVEPKGSDLPGQESFDTRVTVPADDDDDEIPF